HAVLDALRPILSLRRKDVTRSVTKCMTARSVDADLFITMKARSLSHYECNSVRILQNRQKFALALLRVFKVRNR
ncbi:hypothetical protein A243_13277, partial [Pseudomonas syringae pv. actinidiae ICMP 18883]|uniref:hypothetical protein n=1 Tax=Pseudomonas syringae TaxID=317 RepID=UPI0003572887